MYILVTFYIIKFRFGFEGDDYISYKYALDKSKQVDVYDILALGDSRMQTFFSPHHMGGNLKTLNLSLPGGSPIEAYYLMKKMLDNGIKVKHVLIGFGGQHYENTQSYDMAIPFGFYTYNDFCDILQHKIDEDNWKHLSRSDYFKYWYCAPSQYGYKLINGLFLGRLKKNSQHYEDLQRALGHDVYDGPRGEWNEKVAKSKIVFSNFHPSGFIKIYVRKLLNLCINNKINVLIVNLPVMEGSRYVTDTYNENLKKYLLDFAQYDIEVDTVIPKYKFDCFTDYLHGNNKGASKFTSMLKNKYFNENRTN